MFISIILVFIFIILNFILDQFEPYKKFLFFAAYFMYFLIINRIFFKYTSFDHYSPYFMYTLCIPFHILLHIVSHILVHTIPQAAQKAGRDVNILASSSAAADHPVNHQPSDSNNALHALLILLVQSSRVVRILLHSFFFCMLFLYSNSYQSLFVYY